MIVLDISDATQFDMFLLIAIPIVAIPVIGYLVVLFFRFLDRFDKK